MKVEQTIQQKAKEFAILAHSRTNHFYDKYLPYEFHLRMVLQVAKEFEHLIDESVRDSVYAACWLHDVIEDCRINYAEVQQVAGTYVAEIVRACTNYTRGRNRLERMPDICYEDIRDTPCAVFVKLCDRIANVRYSKMTQSPMMQMYFEEYPHFANQLRSRIQFTEMWDCLEKLHRLY